MITLTTTAELDARRTITVVGGPSVPLPAAAEGLGGGSPPIQLGELAFIRQVQVTFAIQ